MSEPRRPTPGTRIPERLVFLALAMGGVVLYTLLPTEGMCGEPGCDLHLYDYEMSWWVFLISVAVTEALLRLWQIKKPNSSKRGQLQRIGIRVVVACAAFAAGYLARADVHETREDTGAAQATDASPSDIANHPKER